MGYYIETTVSKNKTKWLCEHALGEIQSNAEVAADNATNNKIPICVMDNGPFEAAGIAFNYEELQAFAYPDSRRKQWLLLPREEIIKHCPHVKELLNWP